MLGTGTPNVDPERSGPALAVVVDGFPYLIDCGAGLVQRAHAAGLEASDLSRLFITHRHSDHTVGLPDLIFTPWVLGREEALKVYGPSGVTAMTEHLRAAYAKDIEVRLSGDEPINRTGHAVESQEIEPGVFYRDSRVTVEAFGVNHGNWPDAFGFKFTTADRTIVVSGDTGPTDNLLDIADGCDILVHEVYSAERLKTRPAVWQKYHRGAHTSTRELADLASRVRPGLLVLYHQLFWGCSDADLLDEIREGYGGEVVSARDLDIY